VVAVSIFVVVIVGSFGIASAVTFVAFVFTVAARMVARRVFPRSRPGVNALRKRQHL